ncbi:hypothetical protein GW17_00027553 [Ensete ventricosum]|nr:hypothetical protein GW17_00027553 [Ensete ventricosum]
MKKAMRSGDCADKDRGPGSRQWFGEWDCSSAYTRLREPDKSEDKAEPKSKAMSIDTPRNWSLRLSMSRY